MCELYKTRFCGKVAPFAGAWIEIFKALYTHSDAYVAPFAGAWIEIQGEGKAKIDDYVAPFAGAWIEIRDVTLFFVSSLSLPSRERGLKYPCKA